MELCECDLDVYIHKRVQLHPYRERNAGNDVAFVEELCNRLAIAQQISEGVKFIHFWGEVHRDLKAKNGIPSDEYNPLIPQFYLSMRFGRSETLVLPPLPLQSQPSIHHTVEGQHPTVPRK